MAQCGILETFKEMAAIYNLGGEYVELADV